MTTFLPRLRNKWIRMFSRQKPTPWEDREAVAILTKVAGDPWACLAIAKCLEVEIDPGESAADFVSQQLQAYVDRKRIEELQRRIDNIKVTP